MPDTLGLPTPSEVQEKVSLSAPAPASTPTLAQVAPVLASVVAEFQSPVAFDGSGGTGRRFVPVTEARTFDGSGYAELTVPDIVPGTALSVAVWGTALPDVVLKTAYDGQGYNVLARQGGGYGYGVYGGSLADFPLGVQNITVTATWGLAATVPPDVCEAIMGEAASRILVQCFIPLTGVGEAVRIGDFEITTSAGISVWGESSPVAVMHRIYLDCVRRYRVGNASRLKQYAAARRMS